MKPPRRTCSICGKYTLTLKETGQGHGRRWRCKNCYRSWEKRQIINPVVGIVSLLIALAVGAKVLKELGFGARLTPYKKILRSSNKFVALMNRSFGRLLR